MPHRVLDEHLRASLTMATRNFNTALSLIGLCLSFTLLIGAKSPCKCPGPIKYYKEMRCTPVFKNKGDCCPERYNCDHLKNLPNDKCVLYGHQYDIGQVIKDEDSRPCDVGCTCKLSKQGIPRFDCPIVDCPVYLTKSGCYLLQNGTNCCAHREVCPKKEEDIPTCMIDGVSIRAGDSFTPAAEPEKSCICSPGYTGRNVEPYCFTHRNNECGTMLRRIEEIHFGCIPIFHDWAPPGTSCSTYYRCPYLVDALIKKETETKSAASKPTDPKMQCEFSNLTMRVGDELNQPTDPYYSECMKCICEVPPIPTCVSFSTCP